MDIAPLYELRNRLRAAAISGTELLEEDFRLKRAVEGIKPLAAASPVFARIGQMAANLLEADRPDREGSLLETITLVDAVLCTQAQVAVKGELVPASVSSWGGAVSNVPYSILNTLIDALTSSGSGKFAYVTQLHETQPELFEDYRVKLALVRALGASYGELADQAAQWLKEEGKELLPLLQRGFDPEGKKEMVRRIQVMEAIGERQGAMEQVQSFLRAELEAARKDVRSALIYALRHDPENETLLMDLSKTEKGACRKMAFWALAAMDGENIERFWRELAAKKPEEVVPFLSEAASEWASRLAAEGFMAALESCTAGSAGKALNPAEAKRLLMYMKVLPGKKGPQMLECCRRAVGAGVSLDKPLEGEKNIWELTALGGFDWQQSLKFSQAVPVCIQEALCLPHDGQLESFAAGLYAGEKENPEYFAPSVTAHLLMDKPEDFCGWMEEQMWRKVLFEKKLRKELFAQLYRAAIHIVREEGGVYWLRSVRMNPADGQREEYLQGLDGSVVEGYLAELLFQCADSRLDTVLMNWLPGKKESSSYKGSLIRYFRNRALTTEDNRGYLRPLKQLGATDCKGFAVRYFSVRGKAHFWELQSYLEQLPGSYAARADEADEVLKLVKQGRIRLLSGTAEGLSTYIFQLRHR